MGWGVGRRAVDKLKEQVIITERKTNVRQNLDSPVARNVELKMS